MHGSKQTGKSEAESGQSCLYVRVRNIPSEFTIADLRFFFSDYIESNKFIIFHYCRRPEEIKRGDGSMKTYQCIVKMSNIASLSQFLKDFDRSYVTYYTPIPTGMMWKTLSGELLAQLVILERVSDDVDIPSQIEQRPPEVIPQGNVGTPRKIIQRAITACRIPTAALRKLGVAPEIRASAFSPTYYSDEGNISLAKANFECSFLESRLDDDSDSGEEWERHVATEGDPNEQGEYIENVQEKGRIYEHEQEITWDKGGSGIVLHSDQSHWDARRGDFMERTCDDLDAFSDNDEKSPDFIPRDGVAQKIMRRYGWKRGQGLGRVKQGIRRPIDSPANTERLGLGFSPANETHFGVQRLEQQKMIQSVSEAAPHFAQPTNVEEEHHRISTIYDMHQYANETPPSKRRRVRDPDIDVERHMRHYNYFVGRDEIHDDVQAQDLKSND